MNDEQYPDIGELRPQYQNYNQQKCFIAYSEQANWSADILSACEEVLSQPEFNLEPDYARKHFAPDATLRQKALELIANARYGIYDLSYWRVDDKSPWQMPRNVFIELGIAIALNRPTLLLRHASNQEASLKLPNCLQCLEEQILEFSGKYSLKKVLRENLPKWVNALPEQAWWNCNCIFGGRVCEYREAHPQAKQLGQNTLNCHIADGANSSRPDFRDIVEKVLERFSDVTYTYLDDLSLATGYSFLLCTYCQKVRSSPCGIYRITSKTPPEAFIAIGMSIALETQFQYKISKVLITGDRKNVPSLLSGYEVVVAKSDECTKKRLRDSMQTVIKKVRKTIWKPRPLPFIDISVNTTNDDELEKTVNTETDTNDFNIERIVYIENLHPEVTNEDLVKVWSEFGEVVKVDLQTDYNTGMAIVEMSEIAQATASIEMLDSVELMGFEIKLRQANIEDISRLTLNTNFQVEPGIQDNYLSNDKTRLSNNERKHLLEVIVHSFPSQKEFIVFTEDSGLEVKINTIPPAINFIQSVHNLIEWAESRGKLKQLVEAMYQHNPGNPMLQALKDELYPKVSDEEKASNQAELTQPALRRRRGVVLTKAGIEILQAAKLKMSLTDEELAKITGFSYSTVRRIFGGQRVDRKTLEIFGNALGLEWEEIMK